jgi:hypothetical protein
MIRRPSVDDLVVPGGDARRQQVKVPAAPQTAPARPRRREDILRTLGTDAVTLHAQAASDEQQMLSSAVSWAYSVLAVDKIAHLHPRWMDSTPLVQGLCRLVAVQGPDPT